MKHLLLFALTGVLASNLSAQIGIGTTNPHPSSILDITSDSKGLLTPRMTTAQRDAINGGSPSEGLLVYNTDANCLQVFAASQWKDLCSGGGGTSPGSGSNGGLSISSITGSVGGQYPGFANTSVYRNITSERINLISRSAQRTNIIHLGENRKKFYVNSGVIYSILPQYRSILTPYPSSTLNADETALGTVELKAISEQVPNKTWKEFTFIPNGVSHIAETFMLAEDGSLYGMSLYQGGALTQPAWGMTLNLIDPNNPNKVLNLDTALYSGSKRYQMTQMYANGNNVNIKFDNIFLTKKQNNLDFSLYTYSYSENKFYSAGRKRSSSSPYVSKVTSSELHQSVAPATLKESFTLREADVLNDVLEMFNTKLKRAADDEVTFWVEKDTPRAFMITEDGFANVVQGNIIRRIEFPTGVSAKSYVGEYVHAPILASDGKLYDSGLNSASYAPIVYTLRYETHNGKNYSIYENLNLKNKLYAPNATDLNNLNIRSAHGGFGQSVFLTQDSVLYFHSNLQYYMTNTDYTDDVVNLSNLYSLNPIKRVISKISGRGALVCDNQEVSFVVNAYNNGGSYEWWTRAAGIINSNVLRYDDKGNPYRSNANFLPVLWYNYKSM
ncbi:MAG: hypothetical protein N4A45_03600 [Flavobacteriales bacterium]|jgi:hypothetical protein|nr:hypothetical protein [Flavobacteriales bacterium]